MTGTGGEPQHLFCSLMDGLPCDQLVRQTELLLQLAGEHLVELESGEQTPRRPWWNLLSQPQQELFAALLSIRGKPAAGLEGVTAIRRAVLEQKLEARSFLGFAGRHRPPVDSLVQHVLLRPPGMVHPYPAPETILVLISPPTGPDMIDCRGFQAAFALSAQASADAAPVQDEHGIVHLPCPVDHTIFFPPQSPPPSNRMLVVGDGDPDQDADCLHRLAGDGIGECVLFDPGFETSPVEDRLPQGMTVEFSGAVPPEERARLYRSCSAAVHASGEECRENHFLVEAAACGAGSQPPSPSRWPDVITHLDRSIRGGDQEPLAIHDHRLTIAHAPNEVDRSQPSLFLAVGSRAAASPDILELAGSFDRVYLYAPDNSGFRRALEDGLARPPVAVDGGLAEYLRQLLSPTAPALDLPLLFLSVPPALSTAVVKELAAGSEVRPQAERSILLRQDKPPTRTGILPAGFVGSQVISNVIAQGLVAAAGERTDLRWINLPVESLKLYFRPPATAAGEQDETVPLQQLPRLLENGSIDLMYSGDPDVSWSVRARGMWASKPVPFAGLIFATDNQLVTDQLIHLLSCGPTYPFDRFISPTACGARSWSRLQQAIEDWLADCTGERPKFNNAVSVLPFGIETSLYRGLDRLSCRAAMNLPREAHIILSVGRYSLYGKADLLPLLIAAHRLLEKGHDIHLVLCGGGDPEYIMATERMAARLGLSARVHIHSFVTDNDKLLLYGAADSFVSIVDNTQETYGVVILEAMAAGLPVVASEWNGYRELVRHGVTGFLVPTYWAAAPAGQDQLASLAVPRLQNTRDLHESLAVDLPRLVESLESLVLNSELRQSFGEAGRRRCREKYDNVALGKQLLGQLNESIDLARDCAWPPANRVAPPFVDRLTERFDHFATSMVQGNEWLVPATAGDRDNWQRLTLELMTITDEAERQLTETLLAEVAQSKRLTIDGLIEKVIGDWPHDEAELRQRIVRCVKYGLLEIQPE